MTGFAHARVVQGAEGRGQDRVHIGDLSDGLLLVVADGAGGTSGGAEAAELAVRLIVERTSALPATAELWCKLLASVDGTIASSGHGGETTLVAALVDGQGVRGASVGDSGAWLVDRNGGVDLTRAQRRKPLLGSGAAVATPFSHSMTSETLLVATDGLLKYAKPERLCTIARGEDLEAAVQALLAAVRLRSGALQDDVAAVLCRRRA